MDKLLVLGLNDDDVQEALDALGSGYYPAADTTVWLRSLRKKVLTEAKAANCSLVRCRIRPDGL